ncbi:MAG TPA: heavy metal translocating P-type ATPase [Xanthomonadales bacterium]|nr:heavy metal translocating P-type ATPase [Xanthomonadales bacterium]
MAQKLRLDLPLLLPEFPEEADACAGLLVAELRGRPGVSDVHVHDGEPGLPRQLCIRFDPNVVSLARIRELAHAAGADISAKFDHVRFVVGGIGHERRARTVRDSLERLPGVLDAQASAAGVVLVDYEPARIDEARILAELARLNVVPVAEPARTTAGASAPRFIFGAPPAGGQIRLDDAHDDRGHAGHDHAAHDHAGHDCAHDHGAHAHDHGAHAHEDHGDHAGHGHHGHHHGHGHSHGGIFGPNTEIVFALIAGALLGVGFAVAKLATGAPAWLPLAFYVAAYGFGGWYTVLESLDNLRLRRFAIDSLMIVAAAGAAVLGNWAEGALLLFLFSFGHALEHYAMERAHRAIEALAQIAPDTAHVRRDGKLVELPVSELVVGDVVAVRPNERLSADGFVVDGESSVNQAPVTGESIPVDKRPVADVAAARARPESVDAASRVFAGTINGSGALEVEVTRRADDSAIARVVALVSEAEARKSPTQRFTDRFERIFVPAVLVLAVLLLFAWVVVDEPFRDSFYRAMAVIVAASPCALAIATPSAVLSGIARAARAGVLVKGGAPLEDLGSLRAMAFDKTGTLTEGRPRITDLVPVAGVTEQQLLEVAVAVESLSDHPLAAAIVRDGRERLGREPAHAEDLVSFVGRGVAATLGAERAWIGKAEMFGSDGLAPLRDATAAAVAALRERGRTTMAVRLGDRDLGAIGLMDTPRAGAREAIAELHALGIRRMIMISGDHPNVANAIAREVGLDEAHGNLMPEDKVAFIGRLRAEHKVAMVGDGVNDAPAMANSTVGIAMGAAGSDVALETADVALMADDLAHLPFIVGLSRQTRAIIRQNLFASLGMVAFLLPATILGLGIGPAVALHEGSTILVVVNALRLLAYSHRTHAPT